MSFTVVNFLKDGGELKEIDYVSSNWVHGNDAYWPRDSSSLSKLRSQHVNPKDSSSDWDLLPVQVLSIKATEVQARQKMNKILEFGSEGAKTSAAENKRRRLSPDRLINCDIDTQKKPTKRIRLSSTSSSDDECSPIKIKKKNVQQQSSFVSRPPAMKESFSSPSVPIPLMDKTNSLKLSHMETPMKESCKSLTSTSENLSTNNSCDCKHLLEGLMEKIDSFIKHNDSAMDVVIREIAAVRELASNSDRRLNSLSVNKGVQLDMPCPLPLKSLADLDIFSQWLVKNDNSNLMAKQISLVGGSSLPDATRRIFYRLVDPNLAGEFTFTGRSSKEKKSFSGTHIFKLVLAAVKLSGNFGNNTDHQIEQSLKNILRTNNDKLSHRPHMKKNLTVR